MQVYNEIKPNCFLKNTALALGVFDGVHVGHVEIIKNAQEHAQKNNLISAIFTFVNHPQGEITGQKVMLLTTYEDRIELIKKLNVDVVIALEFNSKIRHMSSEDYFSKILTSSLKAKYISVGYDHKFGFNQEGTAEKLSKWGKKSGVIVHINQPININNEPVSSTRIRKDLLAGEVKLTSKLLGRLYFIKGIVEEGIKRGTELGFPTCNLKIPDNIIIPAIGVYAGYLTLQDVETPLMASLPCVINVGHCPTFKEGNLDLKIEAHILDFPYKELYKQKVKIEFVDRLRNEEKFNSKEELIAQIKKDIEIARNVL